MSPEVEPDVSARQTADLIEQLAARYKQDAEPSLVPLLPLLQLKGKPYHLADHFCFEPMFKLRLSRRTYWKCGRQVSKSTSMAAQSVVQTATIPHFGTLFVAPRYEQIRRISTNFVKPFIEQSLIKNIITNKHVENSVLQKSFLNDAKMYFSFAFLDVDRIRGLSVDCVKYDEIQDIEIDFIPIIRECMAASRFGLEMFFGTPKTLDNTLQALWEESSQGEWVVPCGCGKENIPNAEYDLLKMIGDIGPICVSCGRVVDPRLGYWLHAHADRIASDASYHVPQILLPMHYEDPEYPGRLPRKASEKWLELLNKRDGKGGYDTSKFMNEVLGESSDTGVKLVTMTDIRRTSVLNKNERRAALDQIGRYRYRALGVDWGGGGEEMVSTTTAAVVGFDPVTGKTDCIYTKRMHSAMTHDEEARELIDMFKAFQCHFFAHDFGGSGSVRETLMIQAGLPMQKIVPFMYVRASVKKMIESAKIRGGRRPYYTLDKARSLVLQAQCLKTQMIRLPDYDSSKAITHDLLALIEDKHDSPSGADIFLITRNPKMSDDFAHALNYGALAIWHIERCYPDLSKITKMKLTEDQKRFAQPPRPTYR